MPVALRLQTGPLKKTDIAGFNREDAYVVDDWR
jgi:hypothetical protein